MDEVAFGRYQLRDLIGEGGMGHVYKAHDTAIGRDVAIKVLPPEMAALDGYRERFRREAQIAARLSEPHIIPIHDTGELDGRLYLVMPIIDGVDVQTLLRRDGPMSPPEAVRVIEQLAAALNAAHRNGLVHRDIKPSNALMTPDRHVYLIDFGIAHDAEATRLTQTGAMVGTFSYMAPERFLDGGSVDALADVYALTCVLHECLTGTTPFRGTSVEQQIAAHLTKEPPKPSTLNPAIPAGLDNVIARGMAKEPKERYQSAAELAEAARHALGQPAPQPQSVVAPERAMPAAPETQPLEPTISIGTFAYALFGVVLLWSVTAGLLAPWRDASWDPKYGTVASLFMWACILTVIPGLVLLALGRERIHVVRTMVGRALVTLGLGTLLFRLLGWELTPFLGIAGVLSAAVPLYPRVPALARGYLICGLGVLALALVDTVARALGWVGIGSLQLILGATVGLLWVVAAKITGRSVARNTDN
ncbi:serine/threonine protein kinase [Mycobacterium intermedium]|uniref:non-specific serine/threonine protein kinase n=1 Tax=Mycobacterium intermedium TaxID=28445 RepID=A0A1E3SD50_MYCIE|nr:serine/threonine-protein kinase [Mycobacterium intermedium]MCV6965164.1 serine/threonine protein kinase [Mycobacterium intermedium]ODR00106.1 hypothetical protein BHQ20_14400 [Mycobacterium intermedium]OPE48013.1 serine/threonine protein kinase [Mycobacterium intermedium]ORA99907.1 serine/threonine protein kinase [Mycobacterium intermedium]